MGDEKGVELRAVRDPIHGFVELPKDLFETLIDTELFQRLRDVKQLGLAYLVYPSATHTRFEHSLGAAAVMKNMITHVIENTKELIHLTKHLKPAYEEVMKELENLLPEAVVAALLHDIGHMLLSHVSEKVTKSDLTYLKEAGAIPLFTDHELRGIAIVEELIQSGSEVRYKGRRVDLETVKEVLQAAYFSGARMNLLSNLNPRNNAKLIIAQLISSEIDVDRGDFVLRDAYSAGVSLGSYDLNRLYKVIVLVPDKENKDLLKVGILDKGISVIESMLLGRVFMYKDVYLHTISMLYSAMAVRILNLILKREDWRDLLYEIEVIRMAYHKGASPSNDLGKEQGAKLTEIMNLVTDSTFYQMLRKIPSEIEKRVRNGRIKLDDDLVTLYLLAKSILSRRRWTYLLASDELSQKLVNKYYSEDDKEGREAFLTLLSQYYHSAVILYFSRYKGYTGGVLVAKRSKPTEVCLLEECPASVVAKELMGKNFTKLILVFPEARGELEFKRWYLKKGDVSDLLKGLSEAYEKGFGKELEVEKYLDGASGTAARLAVKLESLPSA
ncbi:hypothetical protein EYM_04995 [Ignicoccus islandicus DSM 13165]|uniref:HD/PDEase domain-containing protein n=1 Tax=Ignicoccus islandicus DSM 13165 TaxID=940295 RepID=A0A0U3G2K8_9CREN|nr:HD domain-containing protein [Ignicoccus islandicus]ALU12540.1 hypothetical protein EYM_04995 [Ignicoccus islandicus DSM 13165]